MHKINFFEKLINVFWKSIEIGLIPVCTDVTISFSTDDPNFPHLTRESVKSDKNFQKLLKKQQKELQVMKKRHQKDKSAMHKQHCLVVDKIVITRDKKLTAIEKSKNKGWVGEYLSLNDSYLQDIYVINTCLGPLILYTCKHISCVRIWSFRTPKLLKVRWWLYVYILSFLSEMSSEFLKCIIYEARFLCKGLFLLGKHFFLFVWFWSRSGIYSVFRR